MPVVDEGVGDTELVLFVNDDASSTVAKGLGLDLAGVLLDFVRRDEEFAKLPSSFISLRRLPFDFEGFGRI